MKNKLLYFVICLTILFTFTACGTTTSEELNNVNDQIIDYFTTNGSDDNFLFNYVDEENKVVVVGLLDNSTSKQEEFKEKVVDSKLIKFVKGSGLQNTSSRTFTKTYEVLNVEDSNDEDYLYITIREYQVDEVQTIKIERSLCSDIEEDNNYEFTLESDKKLQNNILSIFNNSKIISITKTDKIGLEQVQDSIN